MPKVVVPMHIILPLQQHRSLRKMQIAAAKFELIEGIHLAAAFATKKTVKEVHSTDNSRAKNTESFNYLHVVSKA